MKQRTEALQTAVDAERKERVALDAWAVTTLLALIVWFVGGFGDWAWYVMIAPGALFVVSFWKLLGYVKPFRL